MPEFPYITGAPYLKHITREFRSYLDKAASDGFENYKQTRMDARLLLEKHKEDPTSVDPGSVSSCESFLRDLPDTITHDFRVAGPEFLESGEWAVLYHCAHSPQGYVALAQIEIYVNPQGVINPRDKNYPINYLPLTIPGLLQGVAPYEPPPFEGLMEATSEVLSTMAGVSSKIANEVFKAAKPVVPASTGYVSPYSSARQAPAAIRPGTRTSLPSRYSGFRPQPSVRPPPPTQQAKPAPAPPKAPVQKITFEGAPDNALGREIFQDRASYPSWAIQYLVTGNLSSLRELVIEHGGSFFNQMRAQNPQATIADFWEVFPDEMMRRGLMTLGCSQGIAKPPLPVDERGVCAKTSCVLHPATKNGTPDQPCSNQIPAIK